MRATMGPWPNACFNVPVKGGLATSLHDRTARRWSDEGCTDMKDPPPGSDRWTDNLMGYCIITPYAKSGIHVHLPWSCLWRSQYIGAVLPCNQLQASTFPDRIILHHWARSTLYWLNTNELLVKGHNILVPCCLVINSKLLYFQIE